MKSAIEYFESTSNINVARGPEDRLLILNFGICNALIDCVEEGLLVKIE